jgi:hypothetical protein
MDLKAYFDNSSGIGILSTSDKHGHVNSAIYSRPHVFDDGTIAFIMRDRLSYQNLKSNSHAAYLFKEEGKDYKGIRLILSKLREEKDSELLYQLRRRKYNSDTDQKEPKFLVFFSVDQERPLIGGSENGKP